MYCEIHPVIVTLIAIVLLLCRRRRLTGQSPHPAIVAGDLAGLQFRLEYHPFAEINRKTALLLFTLAGDGSAFLQDFRIDTHFFHNCAFQVKFAVNSGLYHVGMGIVDKN
jgi:hypothetical protein